MIVVCQYTGIAFEASSKRTRNHPEVAAFLNAAAADKKVGAYAEAKNILYAAAANGGSIEEIMNTANLLFAEWRAGAVGRQVESHSERVQRGARIAAGIMAERRGQNDRDRMDIFGATAYEAANNCRGEHSGGA